MSTPERHAVGLIENYYAIFNSGDREALLRLLTQDVAHEINQGACQTGVAAFREFLSRMDRCYRERVEELVVFGDDEGRRGAAEFIIVGTYLATDDGLPPASGQRYRLRVGAFFELDGPRIARVTNYYNLQEWLRQIAAA